MECDQSKAEAVARVKIILPELYDNNRFDGSELCISLGNFPEIYKANWGYKPSAELYENKSEIKEVDYGSIGNLPLANHANAGFCKIWFQRNSKNIAVRGFYFHDLASERYTVCLITDKTNLIFI